MDSHPPFADTDPGAEGAEGAEGAADAADAADAPRAFRPLREVMPHAPPGTFPSWGRRVPPPWMTPAQQTEFEEAVAGFFVFQRYEAALEGRPWPVDEPPRPLPRRG